jgi:neutral trehalase
MDNNPRFDDVTILESIDFSCFMAMETKLMSTLAAEIGVKEDIEYWSEIHEKIKIAINDLLWDEDDGFYYDFERTRDELQKVKAISSFLPLYAGVCDERQAKRLVEHLMDPDSFYTEYPIPTISKEDPTFGSDMWRGPIWVNYNYLIIHGLLEYGFDDLAKDISKKTLNMMDEWYLKDGTIYEFYDSSNKYPPYKLNRKGPVHEPYDYRIKMQSIRDYGWANSLYPVILFEILS